MNRITDYSKLATDITTWIRDYATSNNIKSLVVGVSGGIDSAVVSTLCAMTGLPTYCCVIDIDSHSDHIGVAMDHCHWIINHNPLTNMICMDLGEVLQSFLLYAGEHSAHSVANLKSRIRMMALYGQASTHNSIVVGTGNKVEDFGVGFFTKYGDGGVDISPIADLYKTEVRELGRYLGISDEILNAAPTDGLWADGRTDEDQIGCTYEELEWAMEQSPILAIEDFDVSPELSRALTIYRRLHTQNQHKMQPIPIYKLTT